MLSRGFCYWAGTTEEEKRVQEETKATIRVIPLEQPAQSGKCILTGKDTAAGHFRIDSKYCQSELAVTKRLERRRNNWTLASITLSRGK